MKHIIQIIIDNFNNYPLDKAVSDESSTFTYGELFAYSKMISANLKRNGVKYGDRIIIEISRCKEYIASLVACWFIGAATIPLSDDYPLERLNYIKKDSQYFLSIDENFMKNLDTSISEEPIIPDGSSDGLIIYTSGSTGNPKGVIHDFNSMSAVVYRNGAHDEAIPEAGNNVIAGLIAPFTFIVGMSHVLCALALKKYLVLTPDEIRRDPFKLAQYFDDNHIESSFVSPRLVDFMVQHNKSLKAISVGSERITNLYYNDNPVIVNGYGCTESFGGILAFKIDQLYDNTPIGKPIGQECAYVLDENFNEVSQGELCLTGYLGKGYLNKPEETKKTFIKNPFKDKDGYDIMIKTNDIVKRLPDGNLVFIERKDWMIKINGQRIEPIEIETAIRKLNGIKSVVIKDFTSPSGVTFLAAYYVSDDSINDDIVKEHCKRNLTSYMVPSFFIKMESLPLNANGKLDRKNLPAPDVKNYKRDYNPPVGRIETDLCKTIENILDCGQVGRDDDFFLLGGDSVKALELINTLDDLPLDVEMIFNGKTPKEIASLIEKGGKDEIDYDHKIKDSYPLTASQLGVYFPSISDTTNTIYNNPFIIKVDNKQVDIDKLISCIEKAIDNHNAYKCHILPVGGVPSMVPYDHEIKVNVIKTNDIENELKQFVKPFNLATDSLVRINLYQNENESIFAFDFHHIVFDGTSLAVFLKEIRNLYADKAIYEEKTSMFELSSYEEALKQHEKYKKAEQFYANLFEDNEIANDFPQDYEDKGDVELGQIIVKTNDFDQSKLDAYLKSNGITENSLFLAAYSYTLAKFNGSDKSLVCVAESGRHTSMTFNTMGMMVKTIALPIDLSSHADISDFIRYEQALFKNSCKNDAYPFTELANKYGVTNDFMFVYQGNQFSALNIDDNLYKVEGLPNKDVISKLGLAIFKDPDGYTLKFNYRKDLYHKEIIASFASTYVQVVKEFLAKDIFKNIDLCNEDEIKKLDSFNNNEVTLSNKTIVEYFKEAADKFPDNRLIVFKDKTYTYKEARKIINKIANYIHDLGIQNEPVSILMNRNEYMILAPWGALVAGCSYEPLDPSYPSERLSFMVKDSKTRLLITTRELRDLIKDYDGKVLYIDEIEELSNDKDLDIVPNYDDIFVLLYTSGTTGTPKGVMLAHKNVASFMQMHRELMEYNEHSQIACYASFGFDAGMLDIMCGPSNGATLHIVDEAIRLDMNALDKFFIENKITSVVLTTQVGRQFATFTKSPYLKYVMLGGEKVVPFIANGNIVALNGYGPTECMCYVSAYAIDKMYYRVPIGKINQNCHGYIVDKNLKRVPIGVPGELLVAGVQVGKGYLGLEEKTANTFIENPFESNEKYPFTYRTGDIVRYLGDGTIDFIGRNDGQVKIRGFRIELTEIESVIREFDGIKDATVTAFDDPNGGKYLAAFVVGEQEIDLDGLRRFIASKKPGYMVPEAMAQIEKIPLTQNHKVNKRALPHISKTKHTKKNSGTHVDNIIVSKLKGIIKEILNDDEFDYDDNLFDFGLNSLSIVRLSVLVSDEFNIVIDTKDLLKECSYHSLESLIIKALLNNTNSVKEVKELRDSYPLNKSQVGVYTEYLKDVESVKYNIPAIYVFAKAKYPNLTKEKLKDALIKVIDAHPSLKCTIDTNKDGQFVMIPHNANEVNVTLLSMKHDEVSNYKDNFVKPHELNKSIYRFAIVEDEIEYRLFVDIHHIMFDGFSQNVFINEILKALSDKTLTKETYSIFDQTLDEEEARNSDKFQIAKDYYTNLLSVVDGSTSIENDNFVKEVIPASIKLTNKVINIAKIKEFIKDINITLNAYFMTAMAITLSRFTYQDNVCFATVYNGRNSVDLSKMMGMTVKTLPFVNTLDSNLKVKDLLLNNKTQILESMANDIYSFAEMSREFDINLQLLFVYQGEVNEPTSYDMEYMALNDLKSAISFEVSNDNENCYFHVDYDNGRYSEDLMNRFVKAFINVCNELLVKEDIKDISLLDENDLKELDVINSVTVDYDHRPIIYLIKDIMKKYPDNLAICYKDKKYTYKELDILTDNIADYLKKHNVTREDVVSILIPRDENMIIGALSVLKTGAAYQPLDPSYPIERLNFMIKDSNAKFLITNSELKDHISEYNGGVILTEDFNKLPKAKEEIKLISQPEDLFMMIYTSGTTGLPKGVMIENRNISALAALDMEYRKVDEKSHVASYASYGFDGYVCETYPALAKGSTIYIVDSDIRVDLPQLDKFYIDNKITHGFMTTQMGRQFALFTTSPYLKFFSFGGEKIVPFYREDAKFTCNNLYGPTETTCYSNHFTIDKFYERVPVGKPMPNLRQYILDKCNHRLPIGAVGELATSGPQVVRGYLNRPEKNAQAFIHNDFESIKGYETVYKTGDIVRMLSDGNIDIIGRNDGQVKVRGYRIELTEVEEIIRRFEGIKDVAVNAYDDPNGGKYIAAFITSDVEINISELNAFILKEKPSYIVPRITIQIDKIPLTANGKVDKRKLPTPDVSSTNKDYVAPVNNIEKEFCDLFATILGLKTVGATDDFFLLGGSSINAAQVVSFAFSKGYDLVYKNVFDCPTPRQLSELIQKAQKIEVVSENDSVVSKNDSAVSFKETLEPVFINNVSEQLSDLEVTDIGNILLFGATGFLGSHILKELIENSERKITCVVRGNELNAPKERLMTLLEYYFEDPHLELFDKRIFVVNGELLDEDIVNKVKDYDFDTIINCAAVVKHFASDDSIEKTNTGGAVNLINLATTLNKKLIHVSTLSIAGESINGSIPDDFKFKENMLNIGQVVDNKYTKSKYDAEFEIKEAILNKGLKAKIIRVGNLMSRSSDGEFQINFFSNNFMNTIKAFKLLGCVPYDMLTHNVEFSQIDLVAKAILLLAGTNDKFNVYHVNNIHTIQMNNVINELNAKGIKVDRVTSEQFLATLNKLLNSETDVRSLNSLLAYRANRNERRKTIATDNYFTLNALYRLGFYWPLPDSEYLSKLIEYLTSLEFFN